ncbi:Thiamine pyrophosphate enzyme, C-terminal TPP binding domain protein [Burkholderiales bacterium]|jgi:acetolactate synthase-1/2/3 large subunit|nr:Thiamine pyrophosphate enzyme, C-terminal TPP binding domain protein [Burkholderiales bacterium]
MTDSRTGARILVEQLLLQGVNHLFCVPGESYLGVLDALIDNPGLRLIVNRHESGSTFMAGAYARLTGQPGVAFVTRGPGACNAAIGIHSALQDSLPLVLFVGQSPTAFLEREAFQEIDCRRLFGALTKWVAQIDRADRIPEFVARAFQTAASGRPGPVVLCLPEDVLEQAVTVADARCHQAVQAAPSDTQIASLRRMLGKAQRPIVIVGGSGWSAAASENLRGFAEANLLPVACAFRFQDAFDNRHPNYVGDIGLGINPQLAERIRSADLVLALGARLGEATTGSYTLLRAPVPQQTLIHAHAGLEELGRVFQADLMINTGMPQLAARLAMMTPIEEPAWANTLGQARAEYAAWQQRPAVLVHQAPKLDVWQLLLDLRAALPKDAIISNGAGNFAAWLHRFFPYVAPATQLAPTSGSMGYAVPAAIAAKISAPDKTVACISGDGDFLMTGQELATACQYNAGVLFIVFNNGMFGTIRMHQEQHYPGRVIGTTLTNPDFAQLARAYGGAGYRVTQTAEFPVALSEALASIRNRRLPALIELVCDPQLLSPTARIDDLRSLAGGAPGR